MAGSAEGLVRAGRPAGRRGLVLIVAAMAAMIAWAFGAWRNPPFSPDSWAYLELSRSLWGGGYRLLGLRGYAYSPALPSGAFPPLWPFLWSLGEPLLNLGARTGLVLSFGCAVVLGYLSERIGWRLTSVRWIGLGATAAALAMPGLAEEVVAARSIPLQLCLAGLFILILLREGPLGAARGAALGAVGGALVLTRFDMAAFVAVAGCMVLLLSRSIRTTAAYGLLVLVTMSPWILASWVNFGELLHSDSSFVASAVDPQTFVTDWLPAHVHRLTLRDDPAAWVAKLWSNIPAFLGTLAASPGLVGLAVLGAVLTLLVSNGRADALIRSARTMTPAARRYLAIAPAVAAPLPLYLATGYLDARYFSLLLWYVLLGGAALAAVAWSQRRSPAWVEARACAAAAIIVVATGLLNISASLANPSTESFPDASELSRIDACLRRLGAAAGDRVLFDDDSLSARWAAVRQRPSAMLPRNFRRFGLSLDDRRAFLVQYRIRFLVGSPAVLEPIFQPPAGAALACGRTVYRLP